MWKLCPHLPDTAWLISNEDRMSSRVLQHTQTAVVARVFARRACSVKVDLADTAHVVLGYVPAPGGYRIPLLDRDLHLHSLWCRERRTR
jgi:hypothetical protein